MDSTNKQNIKKFYGDLAGEKYLREIRRFGLRYDEMVKTLVDLMCLNSPQEILDIGCGIGNIEEQLLNELPNSNITCVEVSPEMVAVAEKRLKKSKRKVNLVCTNILDFKPNIKFDAIFSNLAIHNLPLKDKKILLRKIKKWLKPKGVFLWGEFMDWEDKKVGNFFMDYRKKVILESGAKKKFVEDILAKEEQDTRLTVTETIDVLRNAGFKEPEVLWVYSFLAIFRVKNV